jgi:hypothetical protein
MGWLQEGIDWYYELFKETVLNHKESWVIEFEMDVVESLKEWHYQNASLDEICSWRQGKDASQVVKWGRRWLLSGMKAKLWQCNLIQFLGM